MTDETTSTRARILQAALALFAEKGYQAASIRAIARAVGIKESSIYYHFASKRALWDALLARAEEATSARKRLFNEMLAQAKAIDRAAFRGAGLAFLERYLLDESVYPLIKMLSVERLSLREAEDAYRRLLFDVPLAHQADVFSLLRARGFLLDAAATDARLAEEYQALILFVFERYFFRRDDAPEARGRARADLTELLDAFYDRTFKGGVHTI